MVVEEYVSLMTAKALKELGFRVPVRSFYQEGLPGSELERILKQNNGEEERHDVPCSLTDWNDPEYGMIHNRIYYSCPTLAVAQRWLREEMNFEIEPRWHNASEYYTVGYICRCYGNNWGEIPSRHYQTYEQALADGIRFALGYIRGAKYIRIRENKPRCTSVCLAYAKDNCPFPFDKDKKNCPMCRMIEKEYE